MLFKKDKLKSYYDRISIRIWFRIYFQLASKPVNKFSIHIHILKITEFCLYFMVDECPENEVRWVLIGLEEIQQSG